MVILFLLYILIIIIAVWSGAKDNKNSYNNRGGYLSREYTQIIKGIFILLVFFSHFNAYVEYTAFLDKAYKFGISQIGQMMVTMFLFYSGYGVMESIQKKGNLYIKAIPRHRVLATLLKFDLVVFLFVFLNLILGIDQTFYKVLQSLIAWDNIGNSNWYIFAILILYLFTYISGLISKGNQNKILLGVFVLTVVYIIVLMLVRFNDAQFYNTVICYPLGMFFSINRKRIEECVLRNKLNYYGILIVLLALLLIIKGFVSSGTSPIIIAEAIVFSLFILVLTMRLPLKSIILAWCGNYLFEIYVIQRIPMVLFKEIGLSNLNIYLYFVVCLLVTLILARLLRMSTEWIKL